MNLSPQESLNKLKLLERHFSTNIPIDLDKAHKFIEKTFETKVDIGLVRNYLKEKKYRIIDDLTSKKEKSNVANLNEPDIDDILNMNLTIDTSSTTEASSSFNSNLKNLSHYQKSQDDNSLTKLVLNNLNLVRKFALRYRNYIGHNLSYDDLISEGTIGLIVAIKRFDLSKGVQFSTYAAWWIRKFILSAIINTGTTIRIPRDIVFEINQLKKLETEFLINDSKLKLNEICNKLGISHKRYTHLKLTEHQFINFIYLNSNSSDQNEKAELITYLKNDNHALTQSSDFFDPILLIENNDIKKMLIKKLEVLNERDREIIIERFGLKDDIPKSQMELAERLDMSQSYLSRIERRALVKLSGYLTPKEDWLLNEFW